MISIIIGIFNPENSKNQLKPGDGQTQGKQAEKQTTRRGRNITKPRVIKPRVCPKQSSFASFKVFQYVLNITILFITYLEQIGRISFRTAWMVTN